MTFPFLCFTKALKCTLWCNFLFRTFSLKCKKPEMGCTLLGKSIPALHTSATCKRYGIFITDWEIIFYLKKTSCESSILKRFCSHRTSFKRAFPVFLRRHWLPGSNFQKTAWPLGTKIRYLQPSKENRGQSYVLCN